MIYTGYIDFWFTQLPLPERVAKLAALGVRHIDMWAWRSKGALAGEVAAACREHGCVFNSTFDEAGGSLTDVSDHAHCLDAWAESIERARGWGIKRLFMFSEQIDLLQEPPADPVARARLQGRSKRPNHALAPEQKYANLIEGVRKILPMAEQAGIELWFESLNTWHLDGPITCHTHEQAADLVRRIDHPNFRFTFDCYHQQRTAGNLIEGLRAHTGQYASVHIADVPSRGEPGTGEINYANIAAVLRELNYDRDGAGLIGLEYYPPAGDEAASLARVRGLFEGAP